MGATRFLAHDPGPKLERVVTHLGLDPQNQIIHAVISELTGIDRTHLRAIEAGTFFYAILHLIEGIGLILEHDWAGYLVVIATSSLIPFEIYEIAKKPTLLTIHALPAQRRHRHLFDRYLEERAYESNGTPRLNYHCDVKSYQSSKLY